MTQMFLKGIVTRLGSLACSLALILFPSGYLAGGVQIYPVPAELIASAHYRVEVSDGGEFKPAFVYRSIAQKPDSNSHKEAAWASFAFSGTVRVRVTKLDGAEPKACVVLPSSRRIAVKLGGRAATFELARAGQFSVEFDDDVRLPILIFADPPETVIPERGATGVVWFGPGVHELPGGELRLSAEQTLYLAPGAVVYGRIIGQGRKIRILGRGVLSGERLRWNDEAGRQRLFLCQFDWTSNDVLVDGPTLVNSPSYILTIGGSRATVRNVKAIGWWFNTDGIDSGPQLLVEDCFLMCNDDAFKLYFSNTTVRRCTIWQLENGAPFQISWNIGTDNSGFRVSDCDVIRTEHRWKNENTAVFCAIHGGSGRMGEYVFEDIRIENAPFRLWNVTIQTNDCAPDVKQPGTIANLTFRNITAAQPTTMTNTFRGYDAQSVIDGVVFENVTVGGLPITKPADAKLQIDPATVRRVQFLPRN